MRRSAPRHAGGAGSGGSVAFLLGGVTAAVVYALDISRAATAAAFAAVGLGTVMALLIGPGWRHAEPRRSWTLLTAACACSWSARWCGWVGQPARARGVRRRHVHRARVRADDPRHRRAAPGPPQHRAARRHRRADRRVGTAPAAVLLLSVPAASIPPPPASPCRGHLPAVRHRARAAAGQPRLHHRHAPAELPAAGRHDHAAAHRRPRATRSSVLRASSTGHSPWYDLPFLLGFTMIGAAALHPSVVELGRAAPLPVQAWSWRRLLLIVPAVAVPFVLTAVLGSRGAADRLVLGRRRRASSSRCCSCGPSPRCRLRRRAAPVRVPGDPRPADRAAQPDRCSPPGRPAAGRDRPRGDPRSGCTSSTWTASSWSTTRGGTRPATS